jgi:hypothetical protein
VKDQQYINEHAAPRAVAPSYLQKLLSFQQKQSHSMMPAIMTITSCRSNASSGILDLHCVRPHRALVPSGDVRPTGYRLFDVRSTSAMLKELRYNWSNPLDC